MAGTAACLTAEFQSFQRQHTNFFTAGRDCCSAWSLFPAPSRHQELGKRSEHCHGDGQTGERLLVVDNKQAPHAAHSVVALPQAVALVFEHVCTAHASLDSSAVGSSQGNGADSHHVPTRSGSTLLAQQGAANAALKLLDDLCMMATGAASITSAAAANESSSVRSLNSTVVACAANEAMLKWLTAPCLPRVFVLDLLDFVLSNTSSVFK